MPRADPHSFWDPSQPRTARWELALDVDFDARRLTGRATLVWSEPSQGVVDLDTRGLEVASVTTSEGRPVPFELAPPEPILGARLRLLLPPATAAVRIAYRTAPDASGLQWLEPVQTRGGRHPFLFSQCQAIHARALMPCQDTPAVRVHFAAELTVPAALTAVMGAGPGVAVRDEGARRTLRFEMPQPIPPYLLALAVGRLEARDLSPRSRVWAEPESVGAAAWEFAEVEALLRCAEGVFGPYDWERFDLLVLPPSFPYGGMENPRMTFLSPTLLAGDRSLVDVVAHELAHSWTGNLVTNANAEHFWLNEGWTVWAERRILEALHGREAALTSWALGQRSLEESLARFAAQPELTRLRTRLDGVDPDDAFSTIPYEKGAQLLRAIEHAVGRERFDAFARAYLSSHRFGTITTEAFCALVEAELPGALARVDADAWLHGPGVPATAPALRSERLDAVQALAKTWSAGARPSAEVVRAWSPQEALLYLQHLPRPLAADECAWLDGQLGLTAQGNMELLVEWLCIAARSDYAPARPRLREVLRSVGRMKYLRPLYAALGHGEGGRAFARDTYAEAASGYHVLSRRAVERVLAAWPASS